jgi:hypothetical protein
LTVLGVKTAVQADLIIPHELRQSPDNRKPMVLSGTGSLWAKTGVSGNRNGAVQAFESGK